MSEDRNRNPSQEDRSRGIVQDDRSRKDGRHVGGEKSAAQQQRDPQGQFSGKPQDRPSGQRDLQRENAQRDGGSQRRDGDDRSTRR